jgi:hypothetical protein
VVVTSLLSTAALATVIQTPGLSHFFGCRPLGPIGWGIAVAASIAATRFASSADRFLSRDVLTPLRLAERWDASAEESAWYGVVRSEPPNAVPESLESAPAPPTSNPHAAAGAAANDTHISDAIWEEATRLGSAFERAARDRDAQRSDADNRDLNGVESSVPETEDAAPNTGAIPGAPSRERFVDGAD